MSADGGVSIKVNVTADQANKELDKLGRRIESIEAKIEKASSMRSPLTEQAEKLSVELDKANAKLYEMQKAASGQYSAQQLAEQKELVRSLSAQYNSVQSQVEKYDRQIKNANYDLDAAKEEYGDLARQISKTSDFQERLTASIEKMKSRMERIAKRMGSMFSRALVFNVISRGLRSLTDWVGKTIQQNDAASEAIARLKGALLTLAQPILNVVIPAFTSLVNVLAKIVSSIAEFVSILFGTSFASSKEAAKGLNEEQKALDGVGSAAKSAEKSLAGFDEINKLTASNASGGGGGASSGIAADFDSLSSALPKWLATLAKALHDFAGDVAIKIKKLKFSWDSGDILKDKDAWIVVLSAILGAIIGTSFGGLSGGVFGLLMGVTITLARIAFDEDVSESSRYAAEAGLRVLLTTLIFALVGAALGGFSPVAAIVGGVIGFGLGVLIQLVKVSFDDSVSEAARNKAAGILKTCMYGLIGAIVGLGLGGNPLTGIIGGIVGIGLGLAIHWTDITYDELPKRSGFGGGRTSTYSASSGISPYLAPVMPPVSAAQLPRLASGAVIPPNSEFLAVLGDQKSGTNIEAPADMIRQMVADGIRAAGIGGGSRPQTVILQVDRRELGRVVYKLNNEETQRVGVRLAGVKA